MLLPLTCPLSEDTLVLQLPTLSMPYSFLTLCVQSRTLPWSLPPWTPHALHDRGTRDSQVRRCHLGALCVHSPCGQRTGGSLGGALGASQGSLFPVIGFSRDCLLYTSDAADEVY